MLKCSASPVLCRWSKLTPRFVDVKKCDRLTLLGRILFVWSHLCCLVSLLAGVQRDHRRNASRLTSRFWSRFDLITKHVGIHLSNLDFCVYLISGSEACLAVLSNPTGEPISVSWSDETLDIASPLGTAANLEIAD